MGLFKKEVIDRKMLIAEERKYILGKGTEFSIREAYNALRTNIMFSLMGDKSKIISVTSTFPSEGKSINALNVAIAFADIGKRVVLIDCDMRKPKIHKLLDVKAVPGLSNVLIGETHLDDAIRRMPQYRIDVICAGDIPPVSTRLLESEDVKDLFTTLRARYDYIIVDTPPVDAVIDACVLSKYTNGTLYMIRQNYANREKIDAAVKQLEFAGGHIIGFVLNNIVEKNVIPIINYNYSYKNYKSRKKYLYQYAYKAYRQENESGKSDDKNGKSGKNDKKSKKSLKKSIKDETKNKEPKNKKTDNKEPNDK